MKDLAAACLLLAIQMVGSSLAFSQAPAQQDFVITQFGLEDGLPQNSVNHIIQTKDGYIWMATYGGLVRFDGNSFTVFNKSNVKGLATERILELYEDREGGIWLFMEGDKSYMQRFKNGEIETYSFGEKGDSWVELNENDEGVLWASAYGNMYRFTGSEFVKEQIIIDSKLAEKAVKDTAGVWFAYDYKIVKTLGDSVIQIENNATEEENIHLGYIEVTEYPKHSGQLFIGTIDNGIIIQSEGSRQILNKFNGFSSDNFVRFEKFDEHKLIVNFPDDISVWGGEKFNHLAPVSEELNVIYRSILQDNEGNYWFGTDGDGLFKLRATPIHMIDVNQGLKNEKMLSLAELGNGQALFATNCGGIYQWDGVKVTYSNLNQLIGGRCNWAVYQDSKSRIWIGSDRIRYVRVSEGLSKTFGEEDGFKSERIFGITEDKEGQIWVLTENGVFIYNGDDFEQLTTDDGLYFNSVRTAVEDSWGRMWIGTRAGLNKIENGKIEKIELVKNESGTIENNQPPIRAIYEDADGYYWIGTYGNGLFRIDGKQVTNITKKDGLYDDIISHIVEDESGNFWMGSNRGISMVNRDSLNLFIEGKTEGVQSFSFGTAEGMNSAETNGGFHPSTITDSLGQIYFPTVAGVAVVNPERVDFNEVPPPVYIENLRTNEGEVQFDSSIELSHSTPFLEINYTAISFTDPGKVQFKYNMRGYDDTWIEVGTRRNALYSKIPPGEYTFQVIASNEDGVWNTKGASLNIVVVPPFWQTSWFYLLVVLSVLGTAGFIYYARIEQLKRQNERQKRFTEQLIESEENERKRIALELHDSLGQQILVIKNRVELARKFVEAPKELNEQLDEIMQSAVISIEDVRTISHGLRPVHLERFGLTDAVKNLCEQIQETSALEWAYHVDDIDGIIAKEKEIHFYRVIQEGVNNILKHSQASQAWIIIKRRDSEIKAMLWDNGVGFEPEESIDSGGLGLSGMKERLETLNGTIDVKSAKGEDTKITIVIPVTK